MHSLYSPYVLPPPHASVDCLCLCDLVPTRRERSKVPLIVRQCVEEIERRGMDEVGIYRVSGVATDILALKAAFDSSEFSVIIRLSSVIFARY